MAYTPEYARILGKVTGGNDNVPIRVRLAGAEGLVYVTTDPALPLDVTLNTAIVPTIPGGNDVYANDEELAIAAGAETLVLEYIPANLEAFQAEFIHVSGSGSFKWTVYLWDGVTETPIARRYTSPGHPSETIEFNTRYSVAGNGTLSLRIKAKNIDLTLQADAAAELVGRK